MDPRSTARPPDQQARDDQHDTIVLPQPGTAPPAVVAPAPGVAPAPAAPPATQGGWQQVADWRGAVTTHGPTAWSQVPPFIPPASPPVLVMRNNPAVVGATLGSVSLFLALIPLIGIVAWVLAPIGLLCSAAGLAVGVARRVGRIGAVWGLLTSGLALLICIAWTALLLAL